MTCRLLGAEVLAKNQQHSNKQMAPVTATRGYQSQAGNGSALSSDTMATQNPPNTMLSMTGGQSADLQERWTGEAQQYSPSYWPPFSGADDEHDGDVL